jgi:hypothetical protein
MGGDALAAVRRVVAGQAGQLVSQPPRRLHLAQAVRRLVFLAWCRSLRDAQHAGHYASRSQSTRPTAGMPRAPIGGRLTDMTPTWYRVKLVIPSRL